MKNKNYSDNPKHANKRLTDELSDEGDQHVIANFETFIKSTNKSNQYDMSKYGLTDSFVGSLLVSVNTGGSSGGNCWNDNPSNSYTRDKEDVIEDLAGDIASTFEHVCKETGNLQFDITGLANMYAEKLLHTEISEHCENEFYGNYTDSKLYELEMESFFKDILSTHDFSLFEKALKNVKEELEPAIYIQKYTNRQKELLNTLASFDERKEREKTRLQKDVERITHLYDTFDSKAAKEKKAIETELKLVQKELGNTTLTTKKPSKSKPTRM